MNAIIIKIIIIIFVVIVVIIIIIKAVQITERSDLRRSSPDRVNQYAKFSPGSAGKVRIFSELVNWNPGGIRVVITDDVCVWR